MAKVQVGDEYDDRLFDRSGPRRDHLAGDPGFTATKAT
jgi:hypothetical protein